jgi:hypothetical protein
MIGEAPHHDLVRPAGQGRVLIGHGWQRVAENQPVCVGRPGSDTSIACRPPECHESKTRFCVGVGLCDEYQVNSFSPGAGVYAAGAGWAIFHVRVQPHGQSAWRIAGSSRSSSRSARRSSAGGTPWSPALWARTSRLGAARARPAWPAHRRPRCQSRGTPRRRAGRAASGQARGGTPSPAGCRARRGWAGRGRQPPWSPASTARRRSAWAARRGRAAAAPAGHGPPGTAARRPCGPAWPPRHRTGRP